ncbi:MAG: PASTA domain-containing protein [Thermoanaerobaculia bacterium]
MALKVLGWAAYGLVLFLVFGLTAYHSFNAFVRSGVTSVPEVTGVPVAEARAILADAGLGISEGEQGRYDDAVASGAIVVQRPRAGSLVKRRSQVDVVVSLGPRKLEVPDLRGKDVQSARLTLVAAGLKPGRVRQVFASTGRPGTVVDQLPPPTVRVGADAAVDLMVCNENVAETYLMPDLLYRDVEKVQQFFAARGFHIGSVKFEPYEGVPDGTVLRQLPLAGHPLHAHDAIALVAAAPARAGTL